MISPEQAVFVVTDIETDGPDPGHNSMLSFASVARGERGEDLGSFMANLHPLDGALADPDTLAWWHTQPDAWAAATRNPMAPERAIASWTAWVRGLPGRPVFVAHPLAYDGHWLAYYLRRFAGLRLFAPPWERDRLFDGAGIDLPSFASGVLGWDHLRCRPPNYPPDWLGGVPHCHTALDDATGFANLLVELRRRAAQGVPA